MCPPPSNSDADGVNSGELTPELHALAPQFVDAQVDLCDQSTWAPSEAAVKQFGETGELKVSDSYFSDALLFPYP